MCLPQSCSPLVSLDLPRLSPTHRTKPASFSQHTTAIMNGQTNGANGADAASEVGALTGTMRVKAGLAQMLKGGVIMGEFSLV